MTSGSLPEAGANSGRVLVFVVTYDAEQHIRSIFDRIPKELFSDDRVHFLCIDDASTDAGPSVLTQWIREHDVDNVVVLRNPVNQGYGGNQKLGYRFAVDAGYDFVVLLHGDGRFAPELLPCFIESWDKTQADVVLGSRIPDGRTARAAGRPRLTRIGNRLLTRFQNRLTGLGLAEYHTGYRGYSTSFLRKVPFETDTNEFHFDTQILLQAAHVKAKIVEFPIPERHRGDVSQVSSLKIAKDVMFSTLQYRLHQVGMLCSLKYRDLAPVVYRDKTKMPYTSHTMALQIVGQTKPGRILDIGCGPGFVARGCEDMGVEVTGIDVRPPLEGMMTHSHVVNLEAESLPEDIFEYDVVLLLDIVEHLENPEQFLVSLRNQSKRTGGVPPLMLISTPNVAFASIRLDLLLGRFNYAERGILDITHKRLFTRRTLSQTLEECGYVVESVRPVPVPFEAVMEGRLARLLAALCGGLARFWPTLFAFQFMATCRPMPGVKQVLSRSEPHHPGPADPGSP